MSAPRRIPRVGYLTCSLCRRDLPAEEFPARNRRNKAGAILRSSYCRTCNNEYLRQVRQMKMHDPEYREKRKRQARESYHRNLGAEKRGDLTRRRNAAKREADKLHAAGFTDAQIGRLIGAGDWQVTAWRKGKGRPTDAHIGRLRTAIATIVETLSGVSE